MTGKKDDSNKPELGYLGRTDTWWRADLRSGKGEAAFLYALSHQMDEFWLRNDIESLKLVLQNILINSNNDLQSILSVLKFGAQKYGLLNYRKGLSYIRLFSAFRRHVYYYPLTLNETVDADTGLPHWAHAFCCAAFLYEYATEGLGQDSRESKK